MISGGKALLFVFYVLMVMRGLEEEENVIRIDIYNSYLSLSHDVLGSNNRHRGFYLPSSDETHNTSRMTVA